MRKTFFKSRASSIVFIVLNVVVTAILLAFAVSSISKHGQYQFDFTWMILFAAVGFGFIIDVHFLLLGMVGRVKISDESISVNVIISRTRMIKWENISNVEVIKEMREYFNTVEKPIIIVEGYDEVTKKDTAIKIDYRDYVHSLILEQIEKAKNKDRKKIEKYFN